MNEWKGREKGDSFFKTRPIKKSRIAECREEKRKRREISLICDSI